MPFLLGNCKLMGPINLRLKVLTGIECQQILSGDWRVIIGVASSNFPWVSFIGCLQIFCLSAPLTSWVLAGIDPSTKAYTVANQQHWLGYQHLLGFLVTEVYNEELPNAFFCIHVALLLWSCLSVYVARIWNCLPSQIRNCFLIGAILEKML